MKDSSQLIFPNFIICLFDHCHCTEKLWVIIFQGVLFLLPHQLWTILEGGRVSAMVKEINASKWATSEYNSNGMSLSFLELLFCFILHPLFFFFEDFFYLFYTPLFFFLRENNIQRDKVIRSIAKFIHSQVWKQNRPRCFPKITCWVQNKTPNPVVMMFKTKTTS